MIVKFPLPLDLQYNTGSFKKTRPKLYNNTVHDSQPLSLFIAFGAVTELIKPFSLAVKKKMMVIMIVIIAGKSLLHQEYVCISTYFFPRNIFNTVPGSKNVIKQKREDAVLFD